MKKKLRRFLALCLPIVLVGQVPLTVRGDSVRAPVWAGRFYPADAHGLQSELALLTDRCVPPPVDLPHGLQLRALVLPHAGYAYSGWTAAHARWVLERGAFEKVVLMGPDHRIGFQGGAISDVDCYQTPLGRVPLDPDARRLRQDGLFLANPSSDAQEHSLEVVLPYLQYFLGQFTLVPMVLGPAEPDDYARALAPIMDDRTLVVVSSDLSHFLPYEKAKEKDRETLRAILDLDAPRLAAMENAACGKLPLLALIRLAREFGWKPILLHYSNSGDTAGERQRVVGYAAVAFFQTDRDQHQSKGERAMAFPSTDTQRPLRLSDAQGQALVKLARRSIAEALGVSMPEAAGSAGDEVLADPVFDTKRGTFVTLTLNGRLRGCIGNLTAAGTIAQGVARNAVNAAFHDPRFAPLTAEAFKDVSIEVSLLTPPIPLEYAGPRDLLRRLRVNVDGVIIRRENRSATFLPQVWDQLPHPETFLGRLCRKAGLREDAWRSGLLEVQTYQVRHFEERP